MNTSASHPALTDLCLLIRDHGLGKWFATKPSEIRCHEKAYGFSCTLDFKGTVGTAQVFVRIRTNDDGTHDVRFQGRGSARLVVCVPESHPNFHCGFDNIEDAPAFNFYDDWAE